MIDRMTEEQHPREIPRRSIPRNLKNYFLVLLTRGARWNVIEDAEAEDLLPRHLDYLRSQTEGGRYILAGAVTEDAPYVGVIVVNAATRAETVSLLSQDPGVAAGRLAYEILPVVLPSLEEVVVRY